MTTREMTSAACVAGAHVTCPREIPVLDVRCGCACHEMTTRPLPGLGTPSESSEPLPRGQTARRTAQNRRTFALGWHPVGLARLLNGDGGGQTCGGCAHFVGDPGDRYFKCDLNRTASEATDIRRKWPACVRFAVRDQSSDQQGDNNDGNRNEEARHEDDGEEARDARSEYLARRTRVQVDRVPRA